VIKVIPVSDLAVLYQKHLSDLLQRHRQIMTEQQLDYLIVPSGQPIRIYQDDMDYPFKSSFLFRTYLPLTELPYSFVIIGLTGKPTLIYFQPQDYWHSAPADPDGVWPQHFDIQVVSQQGQAQQFMPADSSRVAFLGQPTDVSKTYTQAQTNPEAVINAIYWQRAYKSDYEIECLRRANQKGAYAHTVAEQAFRAGKSEQQIQLAYVESTGMLEHQMPYGNIVALNQNGAVLHYTDIQTKAPEQTKSFLIDAGVSFNGYHSDITRTYSYENDEFAELIAAMDKVQLAIIESVKTNQDYIDLHISAHLKIAEVLKQFGFVNMTAQAMLDAGITSAFFPHGLGHLIGLQVHDVGGHFLDQTGKANPPPAEHPFCRSTRKMEVGMAFTIEPGLYFIDMLLQPFKQSQHNDAFNWDKIEAFKPYGGIRIEDTIVIQNDAVLNLTRDAFAAL
jgi:Xaa-Pro dipeptidase